MHLTQIQEFRIFAANLDCEEVLIFLGSADFRLFVDASRPCSKETASAAALFWNIAAGSANDL